jgi:hypothetical protein
MSESRNISNSEVFAWNKCQRYYYYSFDLNLTPIRPANALARGIVGHSALEQYYKWLQEYPGDFEGAKQYGFHVLLRAMDQANMFDENMLIELRNVLGHYFEYAKTDGWKILAVERRFDWQITDDIAYTLRLDLAIRDPKWGGEVVIVDHKFVYNFWSQDDIDLNPQLPKYMGGIVANGLKVDRVMVNQIRYRVRQSRPYEHHEMFKRDYDKPTPTTIKNLMREQVVISRRIQEWRQLPLEERNSRAVGVRNNLICKNCSFANLCITDLKGGYIDGVIETEYQQNDYGYNDVRPAASENFQFASVEQEAG